MVCPVYAPSAREEYCLSSFAEGSRNLSASLYLHPSLDRSSKRYCAPPIPLLCVRSRQLYRTGTTSPHDARSARFCAVFWPSRSDSGGRHRRRAPNGRKFVAGRAPSLSETWRLGPDQIGTAHGSRRNSTPQEELMPACAIGRVAAEIGRGQSGRL